MKEKTNTAQIAAEAAKRAFIRYEKYVQKRDVWHMPPQLPLTEELLAEIIKSAIESVYNIGLAHGYEERAATEARLRAAHARKEGDASCPAKQPPNTDTTPQGSNAAPTFNPKGAAAHASDGGVCPNCGVTWDKHSHNCRWRQHASESEKLLPCPFCGSEAVMHDKGQFWVSCSYVGVCPVSLYDPKIHGCTYKEDAIRIWNKRERAEAHKIKAEDTPV